VGGAGCGRELEGGRKLEIVGGGSLGGKGQAPGSITHQNNHRSRGKYKSSKRYIAQYRSPKGSREGSP
jgi:hypothetical protein